MGKEPITGNPDHFAFRARASVQMTKILSDVPEDGSDNLISQFPSRENFGQNAGRVRLSVHASRENLAHSDSFADAVVGNGIALLLQNRLRNGNVRNDRHVVPKIACRSLNRNSKHAQLVPQASDSLGCCLRSNKFRAKSARFDRCLALRRPNDGGPIDKNNKTSAGSSGQLVPCVIRINKTTSHDLLTKRVGCIRGNGFLDVAMKIFPFVDRDSTAVDDWARRIKNHPSIVLLFKAGENVEGSDEVTCAWQSKVRRKHRHFCTNVDSAELSGPTQHSNDRLETVRIVGIEFR
jgi:hypothetical protein